MAITGLVLFGFVVGHLLGNLGVFLGQESFNAYAHFLKSTGAILWPTRIVLLISVIVHIIVAFQLRAINQEARPQGYKIKATVQANVASLYMFELGMILLVFIIVHLLHFTLGYLKPEYYHLVDSAGRHDAYSMLVYSFTHPQYALGYVIAMIALGFHLSHGLSSFIQTLGIFHVRRTPSIRSAGKIFGFLVAAGYSAIPLAVLSGLLKLSAS